MNFKYIGALFVCLIIGVCFITIPQSGQKENNADDFFRIHIRANSNNIDDQNIKYVIRDNVVNALTPLLCSAETKEQAMQIVQNNLSMIENICDETLKDNGFDYSAKATIRKEDFPTRCYNEVTLESGVYDSLIVALGNGTGNNWWCVVYPPLCFVNTTNDCSNVIYKSKLLEIINNFLGE